MIIKKNDEQRLYDRLIRNAESEIEHWKRTLATLETSCIKAGEKCEFNHSVCVKCGRNVYYWY